MFIAIWNSTINDAVSDTRTARRSIAWSSGTGTGKGSSGTTVLAASKPSSSARCNDRTTRLAGGRDCKLARESTRANYRLATIILEEAACDVSSSVIRSFRWT